MASVRHILRGNIWEMQCPHCGNFVPLSRAVFTGQEPFPAHPKWHPSWTQQVFETYGMARAFRDRVWFLVRSLIRLEARLRAFAVRWAPRCSYQETKVWSQDWPATGVDSFGPPT